MLGAMDATTTARADGQLPRWDLSRVYPGLESDEFRAAFERVTAGIAELRAEFDRRAIRRGDDARVDSGVAATFDALLARQNALADDVRTLSAYIRSFVSTDSREDAAQARESELQQHLVELRKLGTRFEAWIGSLDVETLIERSASARAHAFPLRTAARAARHQMSEPEEDLAATLAPSSGTAWAKLHGNVASRLVVPVVFAPGVGGERAGHHGAAADHRGAGAGPRSRRRRAPGRVRGRAGGVGVGVACRWPPPSTGSRARPNVLNRRRGWADALEPALFANGVDRATLDAMQAAVDDVLARLPPLPARQGRALLGHDGGLPWWDLFAPVGGDGRAPTGSLDRRRAADVRRAAFGAYSPRAGRPGSSGPSTSGGSTPSPARARRAARSACRCAATSRGCCSTSTGPSTACRPSPTSWATPTTTPTWPSARRCSASTPMALAETASIFCETIVVEAGLAGAPAAERARPARHRPAGRLPGRGRHPQPLPVRARAVRAPGAPDAVGRRAVTS